MLAAHVHKTPDILTLVALCRVEDLDSKRVFGVRVSEVFWEEEDPFDISAERNVSERETAANVDPKSTLIAFDLHRACSCITNICKSQGDEAYGNNALVGSNAQLRCCSIRFDWFRKAIKIERSYKVSV